MTRLLTACSVAALGALLLAAVAASDPASSAADPFLAYKTKQTKGSPAFVPPSSLVIADRFESALPFAATKPRELLVPAALDGADPGDPVTHLHAYGIKVRKICLDDRTSCAKATDCTPGVKCKKPPHAKRAGELMVDAFGLHAVDVGKPDLLLVPSLKDPNGIPPGPPDPGSHAREHFKCYKAKLTKGSAGVPSGTRPLVGDQFTVPAKTFSVGALTHLCTPAVKNGEAMKNPAAHLLCYKAKPAKGQPKHVKRIGVGIANQLGTLARNTTGESALCVPAVPAGVPTPTVHPTATGGGGATATPGGGPTPSPSPSGSPGLPPDPDTVAPSPDPGVATDTFAATAFLYTGPNAIQTGVAPGTIEPARVAVIRGAAFDADHDPLPGVTITILDHPELGQTKTRVDGRFDLVVNGGGPLVVRYEKAGLLPAQRQLDVPVVDWVVAPDVMLVALDAAMTAIDLASNDPMQVARGTMTADADGARQATILVPQGTTAELVMPDGSTQSLATMSFRATEFTVGTDGPMAMPGDLPATSGFTYAVELSADEAIGAGAASVRFNQPLPFYVENFVGFPVGSFVPTGYYDRVRGLWVPSENGRVIAIVGVTAGLADLDLDGDGLADDGAALAEEGIADLERQRLATLYVTGQELWRVPIPHFTPWDMNWPYGPPPDADAPGDDCSGDACPGPDGDGDGDGDGDNGPGDGPPPKRKNPCQRGGSVIECQTQTLGESISVTGTPYRLVYRSARARGRGGSLNIRLTGASPHPSLEKVLLNVAIAGRAFDFSFTPGASLVHTFEWDGQDAYGRAIEGRQRTKVRIGYVYPAQYYATQADFSASFNRFGSAPITFARVGGGGGGGGGGGVAFDPVPSRVTSPTITLWRDYYTTVERYDARGQGLGGWTLDVHHSYHPESRDLLLGDGRIRRASAVGDVRRAFAPGLRTTSAITAAADGDVYFGDDLTQTVYRVRPTGAVEPFAGTGVFGTGSSAEGIPAGTASVGNVRGLAVATDGSVFITTAGRVRVVRNGIITTYAGSASELCTTPTDACGDGGPAAGARFHTPGGLAIGPDGSLFVADTNTNRVRRIAPDGTVTTVAGDGTILPFGNGCDADDGFATAAKVYAPGNVAVSPDGTLYVQAGGCGQIHRVGTDGLISVVTGAGFTPVHLADGVPASQVAPLFSNFGLAAARNGVLYLVGQNRINRIGLDGIFTTAVGNGDPCPGGGVACDLGNPSRAARLNIVTSLALAPGGRLVYADASVTPTLSSADPAEPPVEGEEILVPAPDGGETYVFTERGRHLRTASALTNGVLREFAYDGAGRLASVTEAGGNTTVIERNGAGDATAIVAPDGQRTTLVIGADGDLARVENPLAQAIELTYFGGGAAGLLATTTDPRGQQHAFTYDASGRLIHDDGPAGAASTLTQTKTGEGDYSVAVTTAEGITTVYGVENLPNGDERLTTGAPGGPQRELVTAPDFRETTTFANGIVVVEKLGPDPRFGMQAPVTVARKVSTPGGKVRNATLTRTAPLADPEDVLSFSTLTDTLVVNGQTWTRAYDAALRRITLTTPSGRVKQATLDARGTLAELQLPGLAALSFARDGRNRLASLTLGPRTVSYAYGVDGLLASITSPLGAAVGFTWDGAGRLAALERPDDTVVAFTRDAGGNVTSLTPPGRPAHSFAYDDAGRLVRYTPPDLGPGEERTDYTYDLDGRLVAIAAPGAPVAIDYDTLGLVDTITFPGGSIDAAYDAAGRLGSLTTGAGIGTTYTYDGGLLLSTTWTGPVTGQVTRTYDNDFRTSTRSVNGSSTITSTYDADGLLAQVGALTIARDAANGLVTGTTLGDLVDVVGRNTVGEPVSYAASFDGAPLLAFAHAVDDDGRIVATSETIAGVTHEYEYVYDGLGRLAEVARDGTTTATYDYDVVGNRLSGPSASTTYTYDAQERLLTRGAATFAYTPNGELASKTIGGTTTTYDYDALGRLRSVASPGTTVAYVIDGAGRRIGKRVNGTLVQGFLYRDGLHPIAELDGSNAVVSVFVYGTRSNLPDYFVTSGVTHRILADHLGSPRLVVRTTDGVVVQRMDYDEFGRVTADTNPGFQPFGFAGGLYDPATGLVRFGARDYDAESGRWTAKDPNGFDGGVNFYVYAENDPLNLRDANGRTVAAAFGPALGAAGGGAALGGAFVLGGAIAGGLFIAGGIYAITEAVPNLADSLQQTIEDNADPTHDDEGAEEGGAPPDTLTPDGGVCGDGGPPETLPAPRNPDAPTLPAPRNPNAETLPVPRDPNAPTEPARRGDTLPSGPGPNVYDQPIPKPPKLPTF